MPLNRREAIGMGALSGVIGLGGALASGMVPAPSAKRRLTVKELQPGEMENVQRLWKEASSALNRAQEAETALKAKYGSEPGVDVNFEDGYVLIRDYRDEMAAKNAAMEQECGQQARQMINPRSRQFSEIS